YGRVDFWSIFDTRNLKSRPKIWTSESTNFPLEKISVRKRERGEGEPREEREKREREREYSRSKSKKQILLRNTLRVFLLVFFLGVAYSGPSLGTLGPIL